MVKTRSCALTTLPSPLRPQSFAPQPLATGCPCLAKKVWRHFFFFFCARICLRTTSRSLSLMASRPSLTALAIAASIIALKIGSSACTQPASQQRQQEVGWGLRQHSLAWDAHLLQLLHRLRGEGDLALLRRGGSRLVDHLRAAAVSR